MRKGFLHQLHAVWTFTHLMAQVCWLVLIQLAGVLRLSIKRKQYSKAYDVYIFHAPALNFGGGECVLWCMIRTILKHRPQWRIALLLGMNKEIDDVYTNVERVFGWKISKEEQSRIDFYPLSADFDIDLRFIPTLYFVAAFLYALALGLFRVRLALQEGFSCRFAMNTEGILGADFAVKWCWPGVRTITYVHYPVVISKRRKQPLLRVYDTICTHIQGWLSRSSDVLLVNSTWTQKHIGRLPHCRKPAILYPPCPVSGFVARPKKPHLISVGHFRPLKRHIDQVEIFARVLQRLGNPAAPRLRLFGLVRNDIDGQTLADVRKRAEELGITPQVDFEVNASAAQLRQALEEAAFGIHTLRQEHFGIAIAEMMAAGVVVVTWNKAGPRHDLIVRDGEAGMLCDTLEEFEYKLTELFAARLAGDLTREERIRQTALRERVPLFSEPVFEARTLELCFPSSA